jgi:catechol 2,3-dioxygenase-like lactoylglutathione lyase family enzyme
MEMLLDRPIAVCDPSRSLLSNEHFQMGYVTNDMAKAEAFFRKRFGVKEFRPTEGDLEGGGRIAVRSVWIGTVMYEIICATGPGAEIYSELVPEDDFAIRLHHLGFLVPDETAWDLLEETIVCGGWTVRQRSDHPGYVRALYVEAPELGHYLEYVLPAPALLERFRATPVA